MSIFYIPSSMLGNNRANLPFAAHPGFSHPFHGTIGGLQAGLDPRNRGRIRSQAEIDAASRANYIAHQQHLAEVKRMHDERLAEEQGKAASRDFERANRQALSSGMAAANDPRIVATELARQQTAAEDQAKREALAARGGKAVRLSPQEQDEKYRQHIRDVAEQPYAGDYGPYVSPTEPSAAPIEKPAAAPQPTATPSAVYGPEESAYDSMSRYAAVDAERKRQLDAVSQNAVKAAGGVQHAMTGLRQSADEHRDALENQLNNLPTGTFGSLPEYLSSKGPSDYLNAFGAMANQGLARAPEAIGGFARDTKDYVDRQLSQLLQAIQENPPVVGRNPGSQRYYRR